MVDAEISEKVIKSMKILVLGNMGTGKTSFVKRYTEGSFSEFYKSTIGADFACKEIEWDSNTKINIQLCDIAGQELFYNTPRVFYQDAVAAVLAFDLTIPDFEVVQNWKKEIEDKIFTDKNLPIPTLLIGTKVDLLQNEQWGKSDEEMKHFCEENGYIGFIKTSARLNVNVNESIEQIVKYVIENQIEPAPIGGPTPPQTVKLDQPMEEKPKKNCC